MKIKHFTIQLLILSMIAFMLLSIIQAQNHKHPLKPIETTGNINNTTENVYTFYMNGIIHKSHGEYEKAIQIFQNALEIDSTEEILYLEIADCYYQLGNFDLASSFSASRYCLIILLASIRFG